MITYILHDGIDENNAARHARSHSIISNSDHTVGNNKLIYSDNSGDLKEIAHGQNEYVLTSTGINSIPEWQASQASAAPGPHTIVSHIDTDATGAELDTLTDNSIANTLHRHSELVASDGDPDPAFSINSAGDATLHGTK
ncbi:MAG: hypothetical protein ACTSQ0_03030, partial [Candidatus Heimdallarchaeota archaeon]